MAGWHVMAVLETVLGVVAMSVEGVEGSGEGVEGVEGVEGCGEGCGGDGCWGGVGRCVAWCTGSNGRVSFLTLEGVKG